MTSLLDADLFPEFLAHCDAVGVDATLMRRDALRAVEHHSKPKADRYQEILDLEAYWYRSLEAGEPAWDVYASPSYVADLWACWLLYSRKYLRAILSPKSLPPDGIVRDLAGVAGVADLGCGIGFATAALTQVFPGAKVTGTNLGDISQTQIAVRMGERYGFDVVETVDQVGQADLVFASEYFEHIPRPVDHLNDVIDALDPAALLFANCFGGRSIGHFDRYVVDGVPVPGSQTGRRFGAALRARGYRKVETKLWNSRPAYWCR